MRCLKLCSELPSLCSTCGGWSVLLLWCEIKARQKSINVSTRWLWLCQASTMALLSFSSSFLKCFCFLFYSLIGWMEFIPAGSFQLLVFSPFYKTQAGQKKAAVWEIENQLSWNCVCLYQPWPWQMRNFLRLWKGPVTQSVPLKSWARGGKRETGWNKRCLSSLGRAGRTRGSDKTAAAAAAGTEEEEAGGKLETWFFSTLAALSLLCLCGEDELLVWNVWVRRRMEGVDEKKRRDILQSFSFG